LKNLSLSLFSLCRCV